MPFRRRVPLTWKARLRDLIWPRMGLRRLLRLYWYRLHRLSDTPAKIAAGFGWGLGVSVNPIVGTHIILGVIGAKLTRSNPLAAAIATFAVNPWTAPPIWFATYYTGRLIEGRSTEGDAPGFLDVVDGLLDALWQFNIPEFLERAWPVFRPMLLGSIPVGIVVGFAGYFAIKPAIVRLQAGRSQLAKKRLPHSQAEQATNIRH